MSISSTGDTIAASAPAHGDDAKPGIGGFMARLVEPLPALSSAGVLDLLRHPLVVVVATALVSGLWVSNITSTWQNRQKEMEIKTNLLSEMSEAAGKMMMATQFATLGASGQSQEDFDRAYLEWEVQRAIVGAKLLGYFPNTGLHADWDQLAEQVTLFYAAAGIPNPEQRANQLAQLAADASQPAAGRQALQTTEGRPGQAGDETVADRWLRAKDKLLEGLQAVMQRVLDTPAEMFR